MTDATADTVQKYLVIYGHPTYPQRTQIINAESLEQAQAFAEAHVAGTRWYVVSVTLYTGP
jgi:hypothetical protein